MEQLVSKEALGSITEAEIHYDIENPPWIKSLTAKEYVPGDGLLYGLGRYKVAVSHNVLSNHSKGSHTLDQALVLFGRPKCVTAFLRVLRGIDSEVDDTFTVILQYESALLVTVKTTIISCLQQGFKYLIRGTGGSYIKVRFSTRSSW